MKDSTFYVHVGRLYVSRERRWKTVTEVTSGQVPERGPDTIGIFAVDQCPTRSEAAGAVIEWLLRDRPETMAVRLLPAGAEARRA